MRKNIFHSILFLCFALSILFCQKNNERILSPYNQINGFELDDWTKSPDFGILEFHSNVDNKGIYFDRVEPSEGIDRFIWIYNRVALPYGTYRVKFNSDYNRLIYKEKIYIGKRIRDLNYRENGNEILLALEESSELGILTKFNYSESISK